ncbi:hypothetical protein CAJAP_01788 [Camponotus japonicus]
MNDGGSSAEVASTVDSRTANEFADLGVYEKFVREKLESPIENDVELKESARWNIATYHLRRSIQTHSSREELWVATALSSGWRAIIHNVNCGKWYQAKYPNDYFFPYDRVPGPFEYSPNQCMVEAPEDNEGKSLQYTYNRGGDGRTYPFRKRMLFGHKFKG